MKVLLCNSFYYLRGGVERCFFDQSALLTAHGHQVIPFCMRHPRNQPSEYAPYFVDYIDYATLLQRKTNWRDRLRTVARVIYFREAQRQVERLIHDTQPDIAHVHEVEHEISPSILDTIRRAGIPIVQTLHDYKQLCPNTNFISHGQVCERCKGHRYYRAVCQRCKRGSLQASLLACLETYVHKLLRVYTRNVDLFVVPSRFLEQKLAEHDFRAPVTRLPHFVHLDALTPCYEPADYCLYFGRLVALKGVRTLFEALQHLRSPIQLYVAGEGELKPELERCGLSNVKFIGHLDTHQLIPVVQRAAFTVFPSECYENYPMAIVESFACGTPVIGSNIGGISELIEDGQTGLLFETGNPRQLAERMQYLADHPERAIEMGQNARRQTERTNAPDLYYEQIIAIYERLLGSRHDARERRSPLERERVGAKRYRSRV